MPVQSRVFIIMTSSLIPSDFEARKEHYTRGINSVINRCKTKYNLIIVENNGARETFLDSFDIPVLYTHNNALLTNNKGVKELSDVFACIEHFGIQDEDFIVKMTGRYYLDTECPFFDALDTLDYTHYDAIIKYGWWQANSKVKVPDCISGLIGLRCKYVKTMKMPAGNDPVEWNWAKASVPIEDDKICKMERLGIYINPGSNSEAFFPQ